MLQHIAGLHESLRSKQYAILKKNLTQINNLQTHLQPKSKAYQKHFFVAITTSTATLNEITQCFSTAWIAIMSDANAGNLPTYELYAIRYATRDAVRSEHFIGGDPHDGPMPMDYFIWLAKSKEHTVVIDTGFTAEMAVKRGREFIQCPIQTMTEFGIGANQVDDVILTHLHYDHSGNFNRFPNAQFHLQEQELQFATGRYMRYSQLQHAFEIDDICGIVHLNYAKKVTFYDGDGQLSAGIRLHQTGGHSAGLQFVSIHTKRGWVVLASDASHYYEHMESYRPFVIAFHVGKMMESFDRLKKIAPSADHIIPGHDPKVIEKYPSISGTSGLMVRLDVPPEN